MRKFSLLLLLLVSMLQWSCSAGSDTPIPEKTEPSALEGIRLSLSAHANLPEELISPNSASRAVGFSVPAKKASIDIENTDWTATLLLRKKGESTIYCTSLLWKATRSTENSIQLELTKNGVVSKVVDNTPFQTTLSSSSLAPSIKRGEQWEVCSFIGGTRNGNTLTFDAITPVQELISDKAKLDIPMITAWKEISIGADGWIQTQLNYRPIGTLFIVDIQNKSTYHKDYTMAETAGFQIITDAISPEGSFNLAVTDATGFPSWSFSNSNAYTYPLDVTIPVPGSATDTPPAKRMLVWGYPRHTSSTTVFKDNKGYYRIVPRGNTDTSITENIRTRSQGLEQKSYLLWVDAYVTNAGIKSKGVFIAIE